MLICTQVFTLQFLFFDRLMHVLIQDTCELGSWLFGLRNYKLPFAFSLDKTQQ